MLQEGVPLGPRGPVGPVCPGRSLVWGRGPGMGCDHCATWESPFPSLGPVSNEGIGVEGVSFFLSFFGGRKIFMFKL